MDRVAVSAPTILADAARGGPPLSEVVAELVNTTPFFSHL